MADVFAPAKVNLFLHVTGRHEGYHTLQTVCFFPSVGDRLVVSKRLLTKADELEISGPFAHGLPPEPQHNLILQVLSKLRENHAIPYYSIHLQKRLPIAAGLGGGSANVGAVLRVISRETGIDFSDEPYSSELTALGADIPACYLSQPLFAEGIGDEILPWPKMPDFGVLLVNPLEPLATREVYERNEQFTTPAMMSAPKSQAGWMSLIKTTKNDLQMVAENMVPEIPEMIDELEQTYEAITARMSGSGATCFALYPSLVEAQVAEAKMRAAHPTWWVQAGKVHHGAEA
ncbi:MAG: 4-(cytidine 5'-diphospho)-2-C-methyl-D-erythritol kinase [Rickettsiales bacterium]|nr:4-(cytidine 5'-diphospho)-2-C-methyl-D-erythritol kinase [Rickettsiales bacterium]